jgi:hypothetical protein
MQRSKVLLIDCLLPLGSFTLGLYTQLNSYLFTTLQTDFYLSTTRLLDYKEYLANFIYLNSSLISTRILTWFGLQSWTLSWLNFFLNSVFKLNWILWSFSWLWLHDLNQLKILIFILLGLDLNRVLYLGIFLVSNSFRSPSTRIDPSYNTRIQLYLLESVLYKLDVPVYKKISSPKQRSLLALRVFVLPGLLIRILTRSGNSPDFLPGRLPGFLPEIVLDSLPESLPGTLFESLPERTRSFSRVLPADVPD